MHKESLAAISWCLVIAAAVVILLEVHRHHDPIPVPPPPASRGGLALVASLPEPGPSPSPVSAPVAKPQFIGNTNTHKFHRNTCRYAGCPNCTAHFHTREEALKAGFRPCGTCDP